jgi:hypothetical protein
LGQSIESLSAEQRLDHYRQMAAHSLQMAQSSSDDEIKAHYIDSAARWSALATEVQRQLERAEGAVPAIVPGNKSSYSRFRR